MDQRPGLVHLAPAWAVLAEKGLPSISLGRRGRSRGFRQTFGETCGFSRRSPGTGRQPSVTPKNDRWDKAAARVTWYLQSSHTLRPLTADPGRVTGTSTFIPLASSHGAWPASGIWGCRGAQGAAALTLLLLTQGLVGVWGTRSQVLSAEL